MPSQSALSSLVDFAYFLDHEGRFTFVEQALLNQWQIKIEEARGKTFKELDYPKEVASRLHAKILDVFQTGEVLKDEAPYTPHAGTPGHYQYIFVPVLDEEGRVDRVAGYIGDITDRKAKEAALRQSAIQSQDILESITEAFFAVDPAWRFTYVNGQAGRILGRGPEELLGKVLWEEYPGLKGSEFEAVYLRAAHEGIAASITSFYPDHNCW